MLSLQLFCQILRMGTVVQRTTPVKGPRLCGAYDGTSGGFPIGLSDYHNKDSSFLSFSSAGACHCIPHCGAYRRFALNASIRTDIDALTLLVSLAQRESAPDSARTSPAIPETSLRSRAAGGR